MTSTVGVARARRARWASPLAAALAVAVVTIAACATGGGSDGPSTVGGAAKSAGATRAGVGAGAPPLTAVTAAGALVRLDPATGKVTRTLVLSGVTGDAVAVSPDGKTIYYEVGGTCQHELWELDTADGTKTRISAAGSLPALSADGHRLAYATQYFDDAPDASCEKASVDARGYKVVVDDLVTHQSRDYPSPPEMGTSLPARIWHLSWSPDGTQLAVSLEGVNDNEGQAVEIINPATDTYYDPYDRNTGVPLPGASLETYYLEGVYLPNGHLFIVRQCCSGPSHNTLSKVDLLEIDPATGTQVRSVAVGRTDRSHGSLIASADGHWLAYLSGNDIELAHDNAKPAILASGFLAVTW
jgi:WD40 repeat protein